jgi:Brp/Blh family beta-carotene 15,15'-monooxygenase
MTVEIPDQASVGQQANQRAESRGRAASLPIFNTAPPVLLMVLLAVSVLASGPVERAALPIAIVGGLVGVPHGAVDHLVLGWSTVGWRSPSARAMARIVVAYTGLAAAAAAALIVAPEASLAIGLLLSALHFGRGEVVGWAERSGVAVPSMLTDALPAIAHGGAVVGLLVWMHPEVGTRVINVLSPQLSADLLSLRTPGLCAVGVAVIAGVGTLLASGRHREAAELALVALTFAASPPLAAFGVYFGGWHALRHSARLLELARSPEDQGWKQSVRRLTSAAAIPTLIALGAIAVMWRVQAVAGLASVITVLLALTVPHAVVVAAMDRSRSGVRVHDQGAPVAVQIS